MGRIAYFCGYSPIHPRPRALQQRALRGRWGADDTDRRDGVEFRFNGRAEAGKTLARRESDDWNLAPDRCCLGAVIAVPGVDPLRESVQPFAFVGVDNLRG